MSKNSKLPRYAPHDLAGGMGTLEPGRFQVEPLVSVFLLVQR